MLFLFVKAPWTFISGQNRYFRKKEGSGSIIWIANEFRSTYLVDYNNNDNNNN